jgi:hypothetical protein
MLASIRNNNIFSVLFSPYNLIFLALPFVATLIYFNWFALPSYGNTDETMAWINSRYIINWPGYQRDRLSGIIPLFLFIRIFSPLVGSFILASLRLLLIAIGSYCLFLPFFDRKRCLLYSLCIALVPSSVLQSGTAYSPSFGYSYLFGALGCIGLALLAGNKNKLRRLFTALTGIFVSLTLTSGLHWGMSLLMLPFFYISSLRYKKIGCGIKSVFIDAFYFLIGFFVIQFFFCFISLHYYGAFFYLRFSLGFIGGGGLARWLSDHKMNLYYNFTSINKTPHLFLYACIIGAGIATSIFSLLNKRILKKLYFPFLLGIFLTLFYQLWFALFFDDTMIVKVDTSQYSMPLLLVFTCFFLIEEFPVFIKGCDLSQRRLFIYAACIVLFFFLSRNVSFLQHAAKYLTTLLCLCAGVILVIIIKKFFGKMTKNIRIIFCFIIFLFISILISIPYKGTLGGEFTKFIRLDTFDKIAKSLVKTYNFVPAAIWRNNATYDMKSEGLFLQASANYYKYGRETTYLNTAYFDDFPTFDTIIDGSTFSLPLADTDILIILDSYYDWKDVQALVAEKLGDINLAYEQICPPVLYADKAVFYTMIPIRVRNFDEGCAILEDRPMPFQDILNPKDDNTPLSKKAFHETYNFDDSISQNLNDKITNFNLEYIIDKQSGLAVASYYSESHQIEWFFYRCLRKIRKILNLSPPPQFLPNEPLKENNGHRQYIALDIKDHAFSDWINLEEHKNILIVKIKYSRPFETSLLIQGKNYNIIGNIMLDGEQGDLVKTLPLSYVGKKKIRLLIQPGKITTITLPDRIEIWSGTLNE